MKKAILFLSTIVLFSFYYVNFTYAQDGYEIGDITQDFELKNVDGKMVSLASYEEAKGYIVIFTCNHCPYSVLYEDRIIELHNTYAEKGYPVVAINPNDVERVPKDSYRHMKKRAKEKDFPFAYLVDDTQEIAQAYGANRTPHTFILQKTDEGNALRYIGAIDNNAKSAENADTNYIEKAVDALLEGEEVQENFTRAIGCTIKWKK